MSGIEITIEGIDEWLTMVDPQRFTREMDWAVQRSAEFLRDNTKKLPPVSAARTGYQTPGIPVDTGRLRQAIQKRKLALMAAEIYTGTHYAGYVHDGTSRMPARPFFKWSLEEFGGEEAVEKIVDLAIDRVLNP